MITYEQFSHYPTVFLKLTGLRLEEFELWLAQVLPQLEQAEARRRMRPGRQRAPGGGDKPKLAATEQVVLTLIWLRIYPTHDVLGFLFSVSQPTVGRYLAQVLPVLEQQGLDSLRLPDPGKKHRRSLPELLTDVPELHVIVDSFEQTVQRPQRAADRDGWYSGKKRSHTVKVQVTVQRESGYLVDISASVPGRTADITLLKQSGVLERLPEGMGCLGDSAYQGIAHLHRLGRSPFKRNKGSPPLTAEQKGYNHAFSSVRIIVENSLCRMRHFQCLVQRDRQHHCLQNHHARTLAVAGLVNYQLSQRFAA
jgi:DDE superfamily endonuclease/Helix-turn-helix of DDE superfamily endonuclease